MRKIARATQIGKFSRFSREDFGKGASKLLAFTNGNDAFTRDEPAQNDPRASERGEERKDGFRRERRATRRFSGRDPRYATDKNRRARPRAFPGRGDRAVVGLRVGRFRIAIRPRFIEKTRNIEFAPILAPTARRQTVR